MDNYQITFAIQGMREACARCAVSIEQALTRLDGIIAAHVNYATERATVMFVPARVSKASIVDTVRGEGFQVSLEHLILNVDGLLYASSMQTVERVLNRLDDVVQAHINLPAHQIELDVFSGRVNIVQYKWTLAKLGLRVVDQQIPESPNKFVARTLLLLAFAIFALFSAGAHAGLYNASILHAPLFVMIVSSFVVYGIGWRFFQQAYETGLQGEFDASVVLALVATASMFGGLVVAIAVPSHWLTDSGFVLATWLTAGWFIVRALSIWVLPRLSNESLTQVPASPSPIKVASTKF